jgi:hypothetical protein
MSLIIEYTNDDEQNINNNILELEEFIQFTDINKELIINMMNKIHDGFDTFKDCQPDILKDISFPINGLIYYYDFEEFFIKNQNLIKNLIIQTSEKYESESLFSSLKNLFNTYKISPSEETIWKLLLTNKSEYNDDEYKIIHAFVKYTLEIICHSYQDFIDSK